MIILIVRTISVVIVYALFYDFFISSNREVIAQFRHKLLSYLLSLYKEELNLNQL